MNINIIPSSKFNIKFFTVLEMRQWDIVTHSLQIMYYFVQFQAIICVNILRTGFLYVTSEGLTLIEKQDTLVFEVCLMSSNVKKKRRPTFNNK
jgi:hypothetical protein